MKAFIGTGLIGAGMVQATRERGEPVVVWNRSADKARALTSIGAVFAETIPEAVGQANRVHIALTADDAVDAVLEEILPHLRDDAVILDHSTTSPDRTRKRVQNTPRFLHCPIFMSPVGCKTMQGIILASGPRVLFDRVESELAKMTTQVLFAGESGGEAAALKLVGNGMIVTLLTGLGDTLAIADEQGLDPAEAVALFQHLDLRVMLSARGPMMARQDYHTLWALDMARKDVGLMLEAAGDRRLSILPTVRDRMDELIAEGEGSRDVSILGRDIRRTTWEKEGA